MNQQMRLNGIGVGALPASRGRRNKLHVFGALSVGWALLGQAGSAWAQAEPEDAAAPAEGDVEATSAGSADTAVETAAPTSAAAAPQGATADEQLQEQQAEIEALKEAVAALQARQDEAEMAAALSEDEVSIEEDLFRIYGFMDMGLQRTWVKKDTLVASLFDTNALTFVAGNINLYFDANPHPDWRALAEVRFTGAPLGQVSTYGGLTGQDFQRVSTEQYDPNAPVFNAPMWGGYTVIERAWIEWKKFEQLGVRVGNFFTPFGIWNVDHGSPTLISLFLPQFVLQKFIPLRQTGIQFNGSFFAGQWETGYRAWVTNGRTEQNLLDFDDDKAFGGRIFVRKDQGKVRAMFGGSFHRGNVENEIIDVATAPGFPNPDSKLSFRNYSTVAYTETIVGADVSLDIHDTRVRAEYVGQLVQYKEGKRPMADFTAAIPGTYSSDGWKQSAYLLIAQQLPWWGLEPYLYSELIRQDWNVAGDGVLTYTAGLNVRFNPSAMFKLQAGRAAFFKWRQSKDFPGDASDNNVSTISSRLVLAF